MNNMKFLIVMAAILGASMGAPEARGKRGLVSSLGYGIGPSLDLSPLHLPLASSVVAAPAISAISAPTVIKSVQTAPILSTHLPLDASVISAPAISTLSAPAFIKTVHSPIVDTVVSQPHIINYAPSLGLASSLDHSLALSSSIPSIHSAELIDSYGLGGLPLTSHVSDLNAW